MRELVSEGDGLDVCFHPCASGEAKGDPTDPSTASCEACAPGRFANASSSTCDACPQGRYARRPRTEGSCRACAPGRFAEGLGHEECAACPDGGLCVDRATGDAVGASFVVVEKGWWRASSDSDIVECPWGRRACPGGEGSRMCGQRYASALCADCDHGAYFDPTKKRCRSCASSEVWGVDAKALTLAVVPAGVASLLALHAYVATHFHAIEARYPAVAHGVLHGARLKVLFVSYQIAG